MLAARAVPFQPRLAASSTPSSRHFALHHRPSDGAVQKRVSLVLQVRADVAVSGDPSGADGSSIGSRVKAAAVLDHHLVIREPKIREFWDVADIQCTCFFPDTKFPLDVVLRSDRVMAMLGNFAIPPGLRRQSLVAVECQRVGSSAARGLIADVREALIGEQPEGGSAVSGAATVDTLAEFLPRRKPFARRRTGIAYLSNVAVRPGRRRRGIARKLVREAELVAGAWGCRSIALHCDMNNAAAAALYLAEGYRLVRVPSGAAWPGPKAIPGSDFQLLLKVLSSPRSRSQPSSPTDCSGTKEWTGLYSDTQL